MEQSKAASRPPHSKFTKYDFRGPYPDVTIPEVSLTDFIFSSTQQIKDKPALIDGPSGRALTYGQLEDAVRRVAASLAQQDSRKVTCWGSSALTAPNTAFCFMR